MSDDLKKARVLARALQSREMIKIHPRQCETLRDKLRETMDLVEKEKAIKASCGKVYRELLLVVHRVKIFIDDCCYKRDGDFVLAAIKVSAHKERFIKYYVELDWCIFLVKCLKDAKGKSVSSETLEGFEWKKKIDSLLKDTKSKVEKDFCDFEDLLRQSVKRRGDHQKICLTLLRRFNDETGIDHSVPDDAELSGVPPFESTGDRIGIGGYGEVYSLKWRKKMFAVKIPLSSSAKTLDKEVAILEKCGHPNIVNLILFHKKPDGKEYLMMEKLSYNLVEYIKIVEEGLPPPLLKGVDMILQVCEGLQYLSEKHHVSHRDLKPLNILVKLEGGQQDPVLELQVADFGLAKVRAALEMSSKNTPNVGTTVYRAPEMTGAAGPGTDKIREESLKADMYSFAVTCSYILTGSEPYQGIRREDLRKSVLEGVRPRLPEDCPPELSSLLAQCWHSEPSKRPASFSEISEKLRKLKAKLLTCDVHEGDESGSSSRENGRITFNSGDRPLRILVLGNSDAVDAAFISICGDPGHAMEDHMFLKESMKESTSASPAVCLYRGRRTSEYDSIDFADIMAFVKERNKSWHQETVMAAWRKDLYDVQPPSERALFPNSNMRLHMVWYVCTRVGDLPNTYQWDDITKKLKGLPVRILVTEANQYDRILQYSYRFFEDQKLEDPNLIIKIDLNDDAAKRSLWQTCWEIKSGAEIKNAATVIWAIRKELGPNGILITVGAAAKRHKAFSVKRSKEFTLTFLCTYWDVPLDFVAALVVRTRTLQTSNFVSFCLQNAAAILYREHEHVHGLVPELSFEAYFQNLDLSACDNWKSRDIQAFLEAVFEGEDPPCPLVGGLDRSSSFAKCIELLCGKGRVR